MTQHRRFLPALVASLLLLGGAASAAPAGPPPTPTQEIITIQRTATSGLAALALIGKIKADRVPGFFANVDRRASGATYLGSFVDFGAVDGLTKYGHGSNGPLCDAPFVCSLDTATNTFTFTITETSDADEKGDAWTGLTRYLTLRGTSINVQVAAIGYTVKRHAASTFQRVTREQADTDGVGIYGNGVEAFRAAQLPGGRHGSFSAIQLPCDVEGAGAVTFAATGDTIPSVANCSPTDGNAVSGGISVATVNVTRYSDRPGLFSRDTEGATSWQVSGAVSGISNFATRMFVLSY